jgi:hypothetical protein
MIDAAQLIASNLQEEFVGVLHESGVLQGDTDDIHIMALVNKIDANPAPEQHSISLPSGRNIPVVPISCITEQGLPAFVSSLTQLASSM